MVFLDTTVAADLLCGKAKRHASWSSTPKYFANKRPTLFACTAFWYLAPGGQDKYAAATAEERTGYYAAMPETVPVPGAIEGESSKVLSVTDGKTESQDMGGHEGYWSNDRQLFWTGGKAGSKLELPLTVEKAGSYEIVAAFTKARDYGVFQISLDGAKLGDPLDLYNRDVIPTGAITLGTRELVAGEHKMTIEITGANEKSSGGKYFFGLDYIKLQTPK